MLMLFIQFHFTFGTERVLLESVFHITITKTCQSQVDVSCKVIEATFELTKGHLFAQHIIIISHTMMKFLDATRNKSRTGTYRQ